MFVIDTNVYFYPYVSVGLELTGNPLECPFSSDDDEPTLACFAKRREEDKHHPLSLKMAR